MNTPLTPPHQPGSLPSPPPSASPASPAPLLDRLARQYAHSPLADLLDRLPMPVKKAGGRVMARYYQLSTTQKVVGGVLLLLAVRRLTRTKRHPRGPKRP